MTKSLVAFSTLLIGLSVGWSRSVSARGNAEFRPALVGNGPQSLVNLIDTARLIEAGEQDAIVFFDEMIFPFKVKGDYASVYPGSAGSQLLQKAVLKALNKAEFVSAIANHKPVGVDFHGTVMFFPRQKPNLRVFANQDRHELARLTDFIAPQLIGGSITWDSEDPELEAARRMNRRAQSCSRYRSMRKGNSPPREWSRKTRPVSILDRPFSSHFRPLDLSPVIVRES